MRPRERQETGEQDLFRSRLDRGSDACTGEAFARDRLAVFGGAVRIGLFGWPRLPAVADAADGRLGASQARVRPERRRCVTAGSRIPISSSSVGRSSSNIGCHLIARR